MIDIHSLSFLYVLTHAQIFTSKNWAYSGSGNGRSANYTLTYSYETPQTGKTLAYLLPLVQLIKSKHPSTNTQGPIALVITHSRELALQSNTVLKNMGCGLRSTACYGGRPTGQPIEGIGTKLVKKW